MRSDLGMGDSLDDLTPSPSHDPEAARASRKDHEYAVSPSGGAATSFTDTLSTNPTQSQRKPSPAPPQAPRPRESLDGETIFAVGDDGIEWSEGEEEEEDERKGLTRKISPP